MFLRLVTIEARKTLKHPALWLGLSALIFLLGCATLINHLQVANGYAAASGGLEKDVLAGLAFFNWLAVLVYAVAGAVIAAFDYMDRSVQLWLGRGVTRLILLSARLITIVFFGWLIVCLTVIAILGLGILSRGLFFGSVDASNLNLAALLPIALRLFWSSLPYLALTVLLAVISRSPLVAAGGTIVYGSVLEMLAPALGTRFPGLIRYLPISLAQVLQAGNLAIDRSASPLPLNAAGMPEPQAILLIGVISLLLSLASLIIFARQDLGG